jgi:hypothetical protein
VEGFSAGRKYMGNVRECGGAQYGNIGGVLEKKSYGGKGWKVYRKKCKEKEIAEQKNKDLRRS